MRWVREFQVAPHGGHSRQGESAPRRRRIRRSGPAGRCTLPEAFGHLLALLVAHQGVDVDGVERHLGRPRFHIAHHHHAGDPEEDDVEAGDQRAVYVVVGEVACGVHRACSSGQPRVPDRPEAGGEPSV